MRVLVIALSDSIHTARWISQINDFGWDLHLFPSKDEGFLHPELKNVKVYHSFYPRQSNRDMSVKIHGFPVVKNFLAYNARSFIKKHLPNYRVQQLNRLIKRLKPDIVHSMEIQSAGYLTLEAKKQIGDNFPPWIVTNWGSDIFLFGRLEEHKSRIKAVLDACDYYSCECARDVHLAKEMGFKGKVLDVLPSTGGFDLKHVKQFRKLGPISDRRLILLKGYQGWAGRALVGLRAIALCADILQGYKVAIYSAEQDVKIAAELVSQSTGIQIELLPFCSHDEMLRQYGHARLYIGLSISDAISTSLLEAIVMGAFPIQSCTSCASEWIIDKRTGFIVPPEDPEPIAAAIRKSILDDTLVDQAAELNAKVARERLDQDVIRPRIISMYKRAVSDLPSS